MSDEAGKQITFTITPTSGDPDLFVSHESPYRPTKENSQWNATQYGSDTVTIPDAASGTYYIGVLAFSDTSYSLTGALCVCGGFPFLYDAIFWFRGSLNTGRKHLAGYV